MWRQQFRQNVKAGLTRQQFELSLTNLYAFHKYVMGDYIKLTQPQIDVMNGISNYMETILIAGSKGGKSTISAETSLWGAWILLNCTNVYEVYGLTPGTISYLMNIAPGEDLAVNIILQYIIALAEQSPLYDFIDGEPHRNLLKFTNITDDQQEFRVHAKAQGSSSRAGRGYAIFRLIMDEASSFIDTRGNLSGTQVVNAYMPRLSVYGDDGRALAITTPRGRSGLAWEWFSTGKALRVIQKEETHNSFPDRAVFQYATWELNPLPQYARDSTFMVKERKRDPWMADREYGGLFADVISAFLDPDQVDSCVTAPALPPVEKTRNYVITADPGFEHDSYAMSMGHWNQANEHVVVDLVREYKPPLRINEIEDDFVDLSKRYKVVDVALDAHLSISTINRLQTRGLPARGINFGTKTDVKLYQNLLEQVNVNTIDFPDNVTLLQQLKHLQRVVRADRYNVEAAPGYHDDLADSVAMLAYVLNVERRGRGIVLW